MRVSILGLGNVLMGDDGFGPYVIEHLRARYEFPAGVELEDLGTPGLDLVPFLADTDRVVLVDTVTSDAAPGTMRLYRHADIVRHEPGPRTGPHEPGVKATLITLDIAGRAPNDLLLVGVVPARIAMTAGLTPELQAAVPGAVAAVVAELERLGCAPRVRETPLASEPWWERTAVAEA
ncbi:MAG: hydrogenase maturation protease [Vicinamibacterales bacterium]